MEQLRVLEEGCGDKDNYLGWGDAPVPTPPQHSQGSSLCLGKGKRLMFKDQQKVDSGERVPRFSHTCVWPWGRWLQVAG